MPRPPLSSPVEASADGALLPLPGADALFPAVVAPPLLPLLFPPLLLLFDCVVPLFVADVVCPSAVTKQTNVIMFF